MFNYTKDAIDIFEVMMEEIHSRICKLREENLIPIITSYRTWDIIYDGSFVLYAYDSYDHSDCGQMDIDVHELLSDFDKYRAKLIKQKEIKEEMTRKANERVRKLKSDQEHKEFLRLQKIYGK